MPFSARAKARAHLARIRCCSRECFTGIALIRHVLQQHFHLFARTPYFLRANTNTFVDLMTIYESILLVRTFTRQMQISTLVMSDRYITKLFFILPVVATCIHRSTACLNRAFPRKFLCAEQAQSDQIGDDVFIFPASIGYHLRSRGSSLAHLDECIKLPQCG